MKFASTCRLLRNKCSSGWCFGLTPYKYWDNGVENAVTHAWDRRTLGNYVKVGNKRSRPYLHKESCLRGPFQLSVPISICSVAWYLYDSWVLSSVSDVCLLSMFASNLSSNLSCPPSQLSTFNPRHWTVYGIASRPRGIATIRTPIGFSNENCQQVIDRHPYRYDPKTVCATRCFAKTHHTHKLCINKFVYIYIYIYICIEREIDRCYIYIYIYTHTYMHIHTHTYTHVHNMYIYIYVYMCIERELIILYIYIHIQTYVHKYMYPTSTAPLDCVTVAFPFFLGTGRHRAGTRRGSTTAASCGQQQIEASS